MQNKEGFLVRTDEERGGWFAQPFLHAKEGNEAQVIAASPIILDAAEWALGVLCSLEEHHLSAGVVTRALNASGRAKWKRFVEACRIVDPQGGSCLPRLPWNAETKC